MKHQTNPISDPKNFDRKVLVVILSLDEDPAIARRKLETAGRMLSQDARFKYLFLVVNRRPTLNESSRYNLWYRHGLEVLKSHCSDIEKRVTRKYLTSSSIGEDLKKEMRRVIEQGRCKICEYGFYLISDSPEEEKEKEWKVVMKYPLEMIYASRAAQHISQSVR
jgi:hypothetical protein